MRATSARPHASRLPVTEVMAGPVAEGYEHSDVSLQRARGMSKTKLVLIISTLVLLFCGIGGVGYYVYHQRSGNSSNGTGSSPGSNQASDDTRVTTFTGAPSSPSASTPPQPNQGSGATPPTATIGSESGIKSPQFPGAAGAPAPAPLPTAAPAPAPAPILVPVPVDPKLGEWSKIIDLPVIPVAIAVLPDGKVLAWSAWVPDDFDRVDRYVVGGGGSGHTKHAIYDSVTGSVTGLTVSNTKHDMFCPGISHLANGDIIVTGGQNALKTSIYRLATGKWEPAADMHISRGYGSSTILSNGKVFVLGGSWSGPKSLKKDAELYDPATGEWKLLPGIHASYILTNDPEGVYRADNYGWFHPWSNGTVFHAGPSTAMHWFDTAGDGSALIAGHRPGGNSSNGISVMYDTGKILCAGGSESFAKPEWPSRKEASLITLGKANTQVNVRPLSPMHVARSYGNAIVLPDGKVFITGGATKPKEFDDSFATQKAEIWDPEYEKFILLEKEFAVPRTYHSVAALLPDGRIVTGGGGLCGKCDVNHLNLEIFTPPYLYNTDGSPAARPNITVDVTVIAPGGSFTVTSSEQLLMVSFIRISSNTHSTNLDQRRLELCGPRSKLCGLSPVTVALPADPGITLPGNWMVFGVNAAGVPSMSATVLVQKTGV